MDRVAGSTASKVNFTSNNNNLNGPDLPEHSPGSMLTRASALVGNLMARALLPPRRLLTVPTICRASGKSQCETSLSTICTDDTPAESLINDHHVNNQTRNNTKIERLPNGDFKLHLPIATTHSDLYSYLVFDLHSYDLSKVAELNLSFCTNLTGQTLQLLGEDFPSLRALNLTGCSQFNDVDLAPVAHMANLEKLCLTGCSGISKQGFEYLTSLLDRLETLDLTYCPQVDDDFLRLLPNMVELKHLILSGCTGFTGDGLGKIGKVGRRSKLQTLTLDQCSQIADADLGKLRTLSQLEQLNVKKCPSITKNGINKLSWYLKSTEIDSDFTQDQENRAGSEIWQGALPQSKKTRLG